MRQMNSLRTLFTVFINHWEIVAVFLLGIATISAGMMQNQQRKEIDMLQKRIEILEKAYHISEE